jgi:hypothetical protein
MAPNYNERVWAGDPATVAEARATYRSNPEGGLIPLAVALYSFRAKEPFAMELLGLRPQLLARAQDLLGGTAYTEVPKRERADKADVLSTYLEWMTRECDLSDEERDELQKIAIELCKYGMNVVADELHDHHTWFLLKLTMARLSLAKGWVQAALYDLTLVENQAHYITDANQRARVYRKLGLLYRKCGRHGQGFRWGMRACLVPGVPLAVRAKSVAALLGIDR